MAPEEPSDPVRATFVAILQQLNRVEARHEERDPEQALYLEELRRALRRFWAVEEERVKLPIALGLLVHNGLVRAEAGGPDGARRRTSGGTRYRITPQGKQFLVEALERGDRIP